MKNEASEKDSASTFHLKIFFFWFAGGNKLVVHIFGDHPGQSGEKEELGKGRAKRGPGKTVSTFYKNQLDALMTTLNATEPHFIRCIVPNGNKMPGMYI